VSSHSNDSLLGLHFFNPVPVMVSLNASLTGQWGLNARLQRLVELISALQTTEDTLSRARAFAVACDKDVTVSKDVPGFVSNALLMPFINEVNVLLMSSQDLHAETIWIIGNHVARKGDWNRTIFCWNLLISLARVLQLETTSIKHFV